MQGAIGGATSYKNQTSEDILQDVKEWEKYTYKVSHLFDETIKQIEAVGWFDNVGYDFKCTLFSSIKCFSTFLHDLEIVETAIENSHISGKEVVLLNSIGILSVKYNSEYGRTYHAGNWHEYGNIYFEKVEALYESGRDYFVTLQDASNAANRLQDYVSKDIGIQISSLNNGLLGDSIMLTKSEECMLNEIIKNRNDKGMCDLQYWNKRIEEHGDESIKAKGILKSLKTKNCISLDWADDGIYRMQVLDKGLTYFDDKESKKMNDLNKNNISPVILLVTANDNETDALLSDSSFRCMTEQSDNPNDGNFYRVGKFGNYDIAHIELATQGSVKATASVLSITKAIDYLNPVAVILVGIAFGKDDPKDPKSKQQIGDVLISTQVADYESGKFKKNAVQSDGPIPECGPILLSIMRHFAGEWRRSSHESQFNIEFGEILSGDKVVDDENLKKKLFSQYSRAIGGEMEGRGAYAACRDKNLTEWIIVKAICDWGDGNKSENKQENQRIAAHNAVEFLSYIFNTPSALSKLYQADKKLNDRGLVHNDIYADRMLEDNTAEVFLGELNRIERYFSGGGGSENIEYFSDWRDYVKKIPGLKGSIKTISNLFDSVYKYSSQHDAVIRAGRRREDCPGYYDVKQIIWGKKGYGSYDVEYKKIKDILEIE